MAKTNNISKADKVALYLRNILNTLDENEKIPSFVDIQKECNVSQSVVMRATEELQALKLIYSKPKQGFYKTPIKIKQIYIIYMANHTLLIDKKEFYNNIISDIVMKFTTTNYVIHFISTNNLSELAFFPKADKDIDALVTAQNSIFITFGISREQLDNVKYMTKKGFKFIHLLPNHLDEIDYNFRFDDRKLINIQLDLIQKMGHERIAYITQKSDIIWYRSINVRYEAFCYEVALRKLDIFTNYFIYYDPQIHDYEYLYEKLKKLFHYSENPPTAILLAEDRWSTNLYMALSKLNLVAGKDIAIVSTNNQIVCEQILPKLTSVGINVNTAIDRINDIIKNINNYGSYKNEEWFFPLEIVERDT